MARTIGSDDDAPWRVRIRDGAGAVLGAGVLVAPDQVLTCAHVVADGDSPDAGVRVELIARPALPAVPGRVLPGCWVPPKDDERGDLALLTLDQVLPGECVAPLRRLPPPHEERVARAFGFRRDAPHGEWALLRLTGRSGPGNEWVQLDRAADAAVAVDLGFSGAGVSVADEAGEYVIGVVVARQAAPHLAWMVLMDTVVRYLPQLSDRVAPWPPARRLGPTRVIEAFVRGELPILVVVVVTGDRSSDASALLSRAVRDAGSRPRSAARSAVPSGRPDGATSQGGPPNRRLQVGIDAAHLTAGDVAARIAEETGIRIDRAAPEEGTPEVDVVIDGADRAVDPEALVTDVVVPLVARNAQVLVGYGGDPPASVVHLSMDALAKQIEALAAAEHQAQARYAYVVPRITAVPRPPARAHDLHRRLAALRTSAADGASVAAEVGTLAVEAAAASAATGTVVAALEGALSRRAELRGVLRAYKAMAANHGLVEDVRLAGCYGEAHEVLSRGRCDLGRAAALVDRYVDAVHRRLRGAPDGRGAR